ncbi:hypothetical protein ACFV1L_06095 [Kitasatospora sp. NPDC059646]|uniref:hypothetical protein n=1 Tax=Kitasatospora sp. NPDC059646 TaxID=3346893 RepID=UPI00367C0C93
MHEYLADRPEIPAGAPIGDLVGREVGDVTVYLNQSGGHRMVRDRMDRADVEYDVYHLDRAKARRLAGTVRELLLEDLPGRDVGGALVLDVTEISSPRYLPDLTSREHVYGGEITLFYVED